MENVEFKKWIQVQIKNNLIPILNDSDFKKSRANFFVREKDGVVQFLQFELKQSKVKVNGGISPIYFPLQSLPYHGFDLSPAESRLCAMGISVSPSVEGMPVITSEAMAKWKELEEIVRNPILAQFEKISSLDSLMAIASYNVPDNDNWNGVKWYAQGVYECLSGNFQKGIEQLRAAQRCKIGYLDYLKEVGCVFDAKKDAVDAIFSYIDLFCCSISNTNPSKDVFLEVYKDVCQQSKQWYKL